MTRSVHIAVTAAADISGLRWRPLHERIVVLLGPPARLQEQPAYGCSLPEAISIFFRKYLTFSGRAGRAEYWRVALVLGVIALVLQFITQATWDGDGFSAIQVLTFLWNLAVFLPNLALAWRRLHDTGRSGLWILIGLVPFVGAIVLIVFFILPPTPSNQYGPGPEHVGAPGAA